MLRILLVIALVFGGVYLLGCGKKAEPVDEYQEAMSLEELTPGQAVPRQLKRQRLLRCGPYLRQGLISRLQ